MKSCLVAALHLALACSAFAWSDRGTDGTALNPNSIVANATAAMTRVEADRPYQTSASTRLPASSRDSLNRLVCQFPVDSPSSASTAGVFTSGNLARENFTLDCDLREDQQAPIKSSKP
jgi:hypothetical protein